LIISLYCCDVEEEFTELQAGGKGVEKVEVDSLGGAVVEQAARDDRRRAGEGAALAGLPLDGEGRRADDRPEFEAMRAHLRYGRGSPPPGVEVRA